jgi:WD40 repeat protein
MEILKELDSDNDFLVNKIDNIIRKLQEIRNKKKNDNENLKSDFNKLFDIIDKIYFNYYTSDDENFNISNSLSEIKLIKEKSKIDFDQILNNVSSFFEENYDEFEENEKYELFFTDYLIKKISTLKGNEDGITKIIKINTLENSFATAVKDSKIKIWVNNQFSYDLEGHKSSIWSLFQNSNGILFSGSSDKTIKSWQLEEGSGMNLFTFKGHKGIIYSINELKNKNLISVSEDRTIKIWSVFDQKCLNTLYNQFPLTSLCICPFNDDFIYTGDENNTINKWNITTNEIIRQIKAHGSTIWSLNLFDDDKYLISAGSDDCIKIWDLYNEFYNVAILEEHTNTVCNAVGMKNGMILSCSWDGTVKMWNPLTRECFSNLNDHNGIVWDVVELNDGKIASVGNDSNINIYEKK